MTINRYHLPINDPQAMIKLPILFILGVFCALIISASLHAQTAPNAAAQPPAAPAPAKQAPDEVVKTLSDLIRAGKYAEAQQLTTGLLVAYPDDPRLVKGKVLLDKLLTTPATPSTNSTTVTKPAAPLTGLEKVEYNSLIELARQAQQTTDLAGQKASLQRFMDESSPFLQKHPDQMLLWQIRAASAISLDDLDAGYDAGQKLLASGAADSNDANLQKLLAQLNLKGWLDKQKMEEAKKKKISANSLLINSLGMKFVPVPGTKVLFCIWDTRVQDYKVYAEAKPGVDDGWSKAGFAQDATHPVVNVSWEDAKAFCAWLTEKEQRDGRLQPGQSYRLPTDLEWSAAVGLPVEAGATPSIRDREIKDVYPWGNEWPPPKNAGNYDPSLGVDTFEKTSPVGSFRANRYGLFDMGGNVWQWCEDWYDAAQKYRVLRGGSWICGDPGSLLSSNRGDGSPASRVDDRGFRCVLVVGGSR